MHSIVPYTTRQECRCDVAEQTVANLRHLDSLAVYQVYVMVPCRHIVFAVLHTLLMHRHAYTDFHGHASGLCSTWHVLQRNGPSAYFTLISALERRRVEQEDAGLNPTSKSLYKVTSIKRILASVVNEHRAAKSKVPDKNSTISWAQVKVNSPSPHACQVWRQHQWLSTYVASCMCCKA